MKKNSPHNKLLLLLFKISLSTLFPLFYLYLKSKKKKSQTSIFEQFIHSLSQFNPKCA